MSSSLLTLGALAYRQALTDLPDVMAWENLTPPDTAQIYIPQAHPKALSPEVSVVVGMRGAGKSFWTAVLASDEHRKYVAEVAKLTGFDAQIVRVGFAQDASSEDFPSKRLLEVMVKDNYAPAAIWRAVLLRHALAASRQPLPFGNDMAEAIAWVSNNEMGAEKLLAQCDRSLVEQNTRLLILFDALEHLGSDWASVRAHLSAILQLCLECRSRRAIRLKTFLRPDMDDDPEIWRFADSSKLQHSALELRWRSNDLYGLVLLHLANSRSVGNDFREMLRQRFLCQWKPIANAYSIPSDVAASEEYLRILIESLAGPWVGREARRGYTYTWIPSHLADAAGRVSPRSVLLAFKRAAEWTEEFQSKYRLALHYEGIKHGVAEASKIRIREIKEDYPWVEPLLEAARGITVPCSPGEIIKLWQGQPLSDVRLAGKLPPRRFSTDPYRKNQAETLIDDLVELAVIYRTAENNRVNIPDIFRVGFGIKRMGGVKPPR
jgi:hypothetical protein